MGVDLSHVNWQAGTIGEWVAGLATAAAVWIAFAALRSEAKARHAGGLERQAQHARDEKRLAAQLRCGDARRSAQAGTKLDWAWQIRNTSTEPFFDIVIEAQASDGEVIPPITVPNAPAEFYDQYNLTQSNYTVGDTFPKVTVTYTDFVGLRWRLEPDGRLTRLGQVE